MPWTRRRKLAVVGVAIACLVVVGLLLPTAVGSWAPILHWTCQTGDVVNRSVDQVPGLLLNSPYGGRAGGNVTYPPGFQKDDLVGEGTDDFEGGSDWAGFQSNVTVHSLESTTVWGSGENQKCTQPYDVILEPFGGTSAGIPILGRGNLSDADEPNVLFPGSAPNNNIQFSNGFSAANAPTVTTCGLAARSIPVSSSFLILHDLVALHGANLTVAFHVPIVGINFQYWFPANFGIWQVDNLSAPGGPGGGWAFSYSPCP